MTTKRKNKGKTDPVFRETITLEKEAFIIWNNFPLETKKYLVSTLDLFTNNQRRQMKNTDLKC